MPNSGISASNEEEEEEQGFVILETNYRLYAYTGKTYHYYCIHIYIYPLILKLKIKYFLLF